MFSEDRGSKLQTVHSAQIIRETHGKVDFYRLLLKQARTRSAVVPERKQTTGKLQESAAKSCNLHKWELGQVALCTVFCKMHAAQLLTVLCSLNAQQADSAMCRSGEK